MPNEVICSNYGYSVSHIGEPHGTTDWLPLQTTSPRRTICRLTMCPLANKPGTWRSVQPVPYTLCALCFGLPLTPSALEPVRSRYEVYLHTVHRPPGLRSNTRSHAPCVTQCEYKHRSPLRLGKSPCCVGQRLGSSGGVKSGLYSHLDTSTFWSKGP